MNPTFTVWLSSLTAFLLFLGVALGYIVKWLNENKANIVLLIQALREIRQRVDEHDDAKGLNPTRKGYTDLPGAKPAAPAPLPAAIAKP